MSATGFDKEKEKSFLNSLVADYTDTHPYSEVKKKILVENMLRHIAPGTKGLQFGCANGIETSFLAEAMDHLTVLDGSSIFIERLKKSQANQNIEYIETLFEDFNFDSVGQTYDFIACNYVLEHVFDDSQILRNIHSLMNEKSILCITVPNLNALSRQLALEMGLLKSLEGLTENDHKHGHRRTYSLDALVDKVHACGFEIIEKRGVVVKILADFQLNKLLREEVLSSNHILALDRMAQRTELISMSDSIFLALKRVS